MTIQSDMALMAAGSYWDVRIPNPDSGANNRAPIPEGWVVVPGYDTSESGANAGNGFSARVYQNIATGQLVISYAGTEFDTDSAGLIADFLNGNIPLAFGRYGEQALAAAELYQRVKADPALSDNITFTGHSLGGGLASVMAVWFDRPAYVFAAAPFQSSADANQPTSTVAAYALQTVMQIVRSRLDNVDPSFASYDPATDFASRETNVQAWAIQGELLEANLGMFNWIEGSSTPLFTDSAITLDEGNKHSIDLHIAGLLVTSFQTQAGRVPHALTVLMDKNLYGGDVLGNQQLIITKLVRNEVGVRGDAGQVLLAANGMLTHFTNDLQKLGTDITGLNEAAQKAIVAQGVEWYYWQGTDYAGQQFFTRSGAVLQYTTAQGANLPGAEDRSKLYVTPWLTEVSLAHGTTLFPDFGTKQQWSVATHTTTAVVARALDLDKSQIFIGRGGADTFTGGRRADVIFAGAGNDTLNGGQGNDQLYGGDGTDTYQFTGLWGKDLMADTDGSGSIQIDGQTLGAAKGAGQLNTWVAELGAGSGVFVGMTVYDDARSTTGKRLVIVKGSDTANTITINNFNLTQAQSATGYLGIQLDPARKLVVKEAAGGINTWSDARFEASSLAGQGSSVIEGGAKTFTVYLNQAAQAGETLTLSLGSLGDKFKALITPPGSTPSVVNAQGAVITLVAGQTQASFVLLQQGAVSASASACNDAHWELRA